MHSPACSSLKSYELGVKITPASRPWTRVSCVSTAPAESQNCFFYGPFIEPTSCSSAQKPLQGFLQTKGLRENILIAFSLQYPTKASALMVHGQLPISLKFVLSNFGLNPLIYITIMSQCSMSTHALSGLQLTQILCVGRENYTSFKALDVCILRFNSSR